MSEIELKMNEYKNKIRLKLEKIKVELTTESLKNITDTIISVYTEEFGRYDELKLISYKDVKEFIEGKKNEPWEDSHEEFNIYWFATLHPALIREIDGYKFDDLIDFKTIEEQVYKNIFENMKSKRV